MASIFSNPIVIVMVPLICVMVVVYVMVFIKPIKKVLLLRPRDRRGTSLLITQETDIGLICKSVKGVSHRFFKFGPAWVFHEGGRMVTRFFGIEGTAYTAIVRDGKEVNVSVKEFLIFLWGEKFYKGIPQVQRDKVETDVVGLTIQVDKVDEEENDLLPLTASDINDENESVVLSKLAEPQKARTSDTVIKTIVNVLLGAALAYFVIKQGYL